MMLRMSRQSIDSEVDPKEADASPLSIQVPTTGSQSLRGRLAATHRSKLPLIVWIILSLIWGSTWLFIKLGLEDLPPFTFAGIRFVIAAAILLIIIALRKSPLPR